MLEEIIRLREQGLTWSAVGARLAIHPERARALYRQSKGTKYSSLADLSAPGGVGYADPSLRQSPHPKGWEKGFRFEKGEGEIASGPVSEGEQPDWAKVFFELAMDPALYEIIEPVNVRTWDANLGAGNVRRFFYYKANFRLRREPDGVDIEELKTLIRDHIPFDHAPSGNRALVAVLTDWQLGKRDGDGTRGIVRRVLALPDLIVNRAVELRKIGRAVGSLYLPDLGDLMEGCDGHYAMQTFEAELDDRQQQKVCWRLLTNLIKNLAPHFDRIVVPVTTSNHGENRRGGKAFTTFGDNADIKVAEVVADILAENAAFDHVSFVIGEDEMDLTLDVAGTTTTFAHGHQMKQGVEAWWKGAALGRLPAMDSTLLITGHRHHLEVHDYGARTAITAPALEFESAWYRSSTGTPGRPGTLSVVVGGGEWSDLQVLTS